MVNFTRSLLSALAATQALALAVHKDAVFLAYDDDAASTIAYDRNFTELGRYHTPTPSVQINTTAVGGRCTSLTTGQLKTRTSNEFLNCLFPPIISPSPRVAHN